MTTWTFLKQVGPFHFAIESDNEYHRGGTYLEVRCGDSDWVTVEDENENFIRNPEKCDLEDKTIIAEYNSNGVLQYLQLKPSK